MNDIDTAAVRAEYEVGLWPNAGTCRVIGELCDALDEARADLRDSGYVAGIHQPVVAAEWMARAEAAEAERDDYEAACNSYRKQVARLNVDLDEARAERDRVLDWRRCEHLRMYREALARSEAAEAHIAKLEICSGNGQYIPAAAVRRMLNGD